jgi:Flp pilus assembly protein TadD
MNFSDEANFLKALQLAPDSAAIHNNIGVTYANLEKFSEAYSHFSKAVMLEPGNMEMQANMKKAERLMELKIED